MTDDRTYIDYDGQLFEGTPAPVGEVKVQGNHRTRYPIGGGQETYIDIDLVGEGVGESSFVGSVGDTSYDPDVRDWHIYVKGEGCEYGSTPETDGKQTLAEIEEWLQWALDRWLTAKRGSGQT